MRRGSKTPLAGSAGATGPGPVLPVTVKAKKVQDSWRDTAFGLLLLVLAGLGGYYAGLRTGRAEGRIQEHTKNGETLAPANEKVRAW